MIDYNTRLSAAILGAGVALVQIQPAQALTKVKVRKPNFKSIPIITNTYQTIALACIGKKAIAF
jgi:hypothetical protein